MNAVGHIHHELASCAMRAIQRSTGLLAARFAGLPPTPAEMEDHRTWVMGELLDTLDRIQPGIGDTLMAAMYPFATDVADSTRAAPVPESVMHQEPLL
jgi:hypothetical protein